MYDGETLNKPVPKWQKLSKSWQVLRRYTFWEIFAFGMYAGQKFGNLNATKNVWHPDCNSIYNEYIISQNA